MSSRRRSGSFASAAPAAHSSLHELTAMQQLTTVGEGSSWIDDEDIYAAIAPTHSPSTESIAVRLLELDHQPHRAVAPTYTPLGELTTVRLLDPQPNQAVAPTTHLPSVEITSARLLSHPPAHTVVKATAARRSSVKVSADSRRPFFFPVRGGETVLASVRGVVAFCARSDHAAAAAAATEPQSPQEDGNRVAITHDESDEQEEEYNGKGSGDNNNNNNGTCSSKQARWTTLTCCDIGLVDVRATRAPSDPDECDERTTSHAECGLVLKISSEFGFMHASIPLERTALTVKSSKTVFFLNEIRATTTSVGGGVTDTPPPSRLVAFRVTAHSDKTRRDLMDLVHKARDLSCTAPPDSNQRHAFESTEAGVDVLSYPHLACTDMYSFHWPHSSIFGVVVCEHSTMNARATASTFFRTVAPYWLVMLLVLSVQCGVLYFVWQITADADTSCEDTSHLLQLMAVLVFSTQVYRDLWESVKMAVYIRWLPVADLHRGRFLTSQFGLFYFVVDDSGLPVDFCRDVAGHGVPAALKGVFYVLVIVPKVAIACALWWYGCSFLLLSSESNAELLLNAVALLFVLDIDDYVVDLVPDHARSAAWPPHVISQSDEQQQPLVDWTRAHKGWPTWCYGLAAGDALQIWTDFGAFIIPAIVVGATFAVASVLC